MNSVKKAPTDKTSTGFRPDIEGLRAIAIVAVLLCHAGLPFARRRLRRRRRLLRHLRLPDHPPAARTSSSGTGTISLRGFYARRAKRLLPLSAILLATVGDPLAAPPLAAARGRSLRRHHQLRPLRRQLALRRAVGRLLRPGHRTEPGPAPLVAGDRGAVLPRLADPDARRHLVLAPPRRARSGRCSGSTLAIVFAGSLASASTHRRPARRRLLLDLRPRLGARRSARLWRCSARCACRALAAAALGWAGVGGDRLRRLRLRRSDALPRHRRRCSRPSAPRR